MKLYPKKLHSLHELEQEKKVMKYALKQIDIEDTFPLSLFKKNSNKEEAKKTPLDELSGSPLVGIFMNVVLPLLKKRHSKKKHKQEDEVPADEHDKKSFFKRAVIQFAGGYLKWKAIELAANGVKVLLSKKKK